MRWSELEKKQVKLDVVMEKVARFLRRRDTHRHEKLVSLVEPMMIAFVGIFIAFIAFTMYSTMFQMQNQLGK